MRSRRRRSRTHHIIADVNITPLVDTCLVLLIMFMIATPIMVQQAIPVNLPKARRGTQVSAQNSTFVTVSSEAGKVNYYFMQDKNPVDLKSLDTLMSQRINPQKKETVYIYSDGKAPMESVIAVVDIITSRGGRVSLITDQGQ